jgi:hypothetical protein
LNWRQGLHYFKGLVTGETKLVYGKFIPLNLDILAKSEKEKQLKFEKQLFKAKAFTIRFAIGPVPIWIDFNSILKFRTSALFKHETSLTFNGNFNSLLSIGFEYDSKRPNGENKFKLLRDYKQSNINDLLPKPVFKTNIDINTDLSLIPEIEVLFFSSAGLRLGLVPTLGATLKGEFGVKNSCERNQVYYEANFGLKGYSQLLQLKLWKFGEFSLGGLLPYPKNPINEFDIIEKKVLKKGCFKFK